MATAPHLQTQLGRQLCLRAVCFLLTASPGPLPSSPRLGLGKQIDAATGERLVLLATGTVGNGRRSGTGGDRRRSPGGDPGNGPHRWWAVLLPSPAKCRSLLVPPSNTPATRRLADANERLELARGRYLALP